MKQYHDLLKHILTNGEEHDDRTGVGTLSVFGYQFRHNMQEGFPLLTTKKLPFRWIAEELFWFLRGSTNEHELEAKNVDIWKEWATKEQTGKFGRHVGDLGPVYGELWRSFPVGVRKKEILRSENGEVFLDPKRVVIVDQVEWLMKEIQDNRNSRRLIVTGWHPYYQTQVALPPCHTLWQIKVQSNRYMSLHLYARSIDSLLGLPFNIASYGLLLSLIGAATGYFPKDLIISFGDLHIYKNHIAQVEEQLSREPRALPELKVRTWEESEDARWTPLARLLAYKYEDLELLNYNPHPKISAPVAV